MKVLKTMQVNLDKRLKTIREFKSWELSYIEFLIKLSKPIKDDLPVGWCVWMIG